MLQTQGALLLEFRDILRLLPRRFMKAATYLPLADKWGGRSLPLAVFLSR